MLINPKEEIFIFFLPRTVDLDEKVSKLKWQLKGIRNILMIISKVLSEKT